MTSTLPTDLREGEIATDAPPPDNARLQFIGTIRTPFVTRDLCPRQGRLEGPECRLELLPHWEPALEGPDCIDETPLLDIKPERCSCTPQAPDNSADHD
ncbi:MAG: hypothetical protein MRY75_04045 [Marivita sp.]|uniref:hypothetical protein n=1 Tax=Marivita sp. TaxID=2003365 RepID=UPI0025BBF219|nr:hypothetical protein [Marivita sp.]MCI5109705.1 hypothetical protein [Marivita sp.]